MAETFSSPWHAAMDRIADAYVHACEVHGVLPDPWIVGSLRADAKQRTRLERRDDRPTPADTWTEILARLEALKDTRAEIERLGERPHEPVLNALSDWATLISDDAA